MDKFYVSACIPMNMRQTVSKSRLKDKITPTR